ELGHLHVEEQQVGLVLGDRFYRLQSVLAFGDDFDFCVRAEQFAQHLARQLFVVNDQGTQTCRRLAHVLSPYSAGNVMLTRKRSSLGSIRSVASLPYRASSLLRTFLSPTPLLRRGGASSSRSFSTTMSRRPSSTCASNRMLPPSAMDAIP